MNKKIRRQLKARKRRIERRLAASAGCHQGSQLSAQNIKYEIADRQQAVAAGGIGLIHRMVKVLRLDNAINQHVSLFKFWLPYSESDHVLNMAYNILAGGTCIEHLEFRRNDEGWLNALGAQRIPDPTTAGDFCRRFNPVSIWMLMEVFNAIRTKVWRQQPSHFFDEAIIDGDGTLVETGGECKQGMDINYKGQWGYHPLMISLANTGEPLYIVNRSGNRPSHEGAAAWFSNAVALCRKAGFRKVRLRGDTDFSQTDFLDGWDDDSVTFVFGFDATAKLYEIAENLPEEAWSTLQRKPRYEVKTSSRARPHRVKQEVVEGREFEDIRLVREHVAEFPYRPVACDRDYRMIVVWKELEVHKGQRKLFDNAKCHFYLTNDRESSASQIVTEQANKRCHQENIIEQHKNGVHALKAPLDNLLSNWAYMVICSLAWSLKAWAALLLPVSARWRDRHEQQKQKLLRMEFPTFRQAMINIPAQIIRSGRRLTYRLLGWNDWQPVFFRLWERLSRPTLC